MQTFQFLFPFKFHRVPEIGQRMGAVQQVFFNANALPRINIGADVWGEPGIMTGVFIADARLLCNRTGFV